MGAVTFMLDVRLVESLKKVLPLSVFVETGTFKGDTLAAVAPFFNRAISVEYSEPLWKEAVSRFENVRNIELHLGNSPDVLAEIRSALGDQSILFWLDAHWCVADDTAVDKSQCPLLEEITAIKYLSNDSVVLIDDARLFLAPPPEPHEISQWPSFDKIISALRRLSNQHELMVINDVIVFYPRIAQDQITSYARKIGVDWLRANQSLTENTGLRAAMEEKEEALLLLTNSLEEKEKSLEEKEEALLLLTNSLEEKEKSLEEKEEALLLLTNSLEEKEKSLEEKEGALLLLTKSLEEKEALIHLQHNTRLQLTKSLEEKEAAIKEKEAVIHAQHDAWLQLTKSLEEKEVVIQELIKAVAAYRSAFPIWGYVTHPVNRIVSNITRSVNRVGLAMQIVKHKSRAIFAFRLGHLIQHGPRDLRLPTHYARPVHVSQPPKISIVTPSFKQAGFIERTMKSVLDQNYPNLEYFVQDGGSADGTEEILSRYRDRLTDWESRPDSGQSEAINLGFARTTGEIMAWLNSDDILLPGALAYVAEYFNRHPEVDVVYGHRILIDENDQQIGRWMLPAHDDEVLSWSDYIPQETMFWRRRIWDKAGGQIDESFRFAMDWDLLARFREAGARFARLPRFLSGFRIHAHQKTSAEISGIGIQEMTRIRQRLLGRVPSDAEIYQAMLPYMRKHIVTDLWWRIRNKLGVPS